MINRVTLLGNLGKDPEVRHLESGAVVATFPMATNENYRDKTGNWQTITQWHNIVVWRDLAERIGKQLKKGGLVYVEGKLSTRKYQDKDGNDKYITEVVGNVVRNLERRDEDQSTSQPSDSGSSTKDSGVEKMEGFDEDDLPF